MLLYTDFHMLCFLENSNFEIRNLHLTRFILKAFISSIVIVLKDSALQDWTIKILVYTANGWGFGPGHIDPCWQARRQISLAATHLLP